MRASSFYSATDVNLGTVCLKRIDCIAKYEIENQTLHFRGWRAVLPQRHSEMLSRHILLFSISFSPLCRLSEAMQKEERTLLCQFREKKHRDLTS